jgi:hypothetical protein
MHGEPGTSPAAADPLAASLAGPQGLPTIIDPEVPSIARVYDYMLGGKDNFASDRAVGDQLHQIQPDAKATTLENRGILIRAVRYLATEAGIDQFIDVGSGLPTQENVHQVAQAANPAARVVYVDNDPIVLAHGRSLLAENEGTTVLQAEMKEPEEICRRAAEEGGIDLSRPVGLILCGVLHHLDDADDPQGIVARFADRLVPGSHVFITHFVTGTELSAQIERILLADLGSGRFRDAGEIRALFGDLELLEPGVVHLPLWRPDRPEPDDPEDMPEWRRIMLGGLARKP